jgi:hypothetical protein
MLLTWKIGTNKAKIGLKFLSDLEQVRVLIFVLKMLLADGPNGLRLGGA